jgi:hypothetical protein
LESNVALIHASSGLVRPMTAPSKGVIKESLTAQIAASLYYQSQVMASLSTNKRVASKFQKLMFDAVQQEFGLYIDAQARSKPKQFHHVYEWNMVGSDGARLFQLTKIPTQGLQLNFSYSFLPSKSKVPSLNKRSFVFANKASIMENANSVLISPVNAERLVFEAKAGYTVFMPKGKSVTIKNPGGVAVKYSFRNAYERFFTGPLVNAAIKNSGVTSVLGTDIVKALKLPGQVKKIKYAFSPNSLKSEAEARINQVFAEGAYA